MNTPKNGFFVDWDGSTWATNDPTFPYRVEIKGDTVEIITESKEIIWTTTYWASLDALSLAMSDLKCTLSNPFEYYQLARKSDDGEQIISTQFGDFQMSDIRDMQCYLEKKHKTTFDSPYGFHTCTRKLFVRKTVIEQHQKSITQIADSHFADSTVTYVSNYNQCASGPFIGSQNWNGSRKICVELFRDYGEISYSDFTKIDEYYFFKDANSISRFFVFDTKGFNYLMWNHLNHEQKVARQLIEFLGGTFEQYGIKTRYNLSKFFEDALSGKLGEVDFKNPNANLDQADCIIQTKSGEFCCIARFDGYERSLVMRDILSSNEKKKRSSLKM